MGIKVGGIDLAEGVINSELRILILEKIVDLLLNQFGGEMLLTPEKFDEIRRRAMEELRQKYPDAGIEPKSP